MVDGLSRRRLTPRITKGENDLILQLFRNNSQITLRNAKAKLPRKIINISHETIRNGLHARRLKWRTTIQKQLLMANHVITWQHSIYKSSQLGNRNVLSVSLVMKLLFGQLVPLNEPDQRLQIKSSRKL